MEMNHLNRGLATIFGVGLLSASALAHGPQIQIGIQDGQIVTRQLFEDEPYDGGVTPVRRLYEIEMLERSLGDANDGWYTQPSEEVPFTGPGIATALGGFSTGSVLSLTFADGLKVWNGVGFSDPGSEQIDAYRGAMHVAGAVTSDAGPFQSFSFTPISGGSDEHKTAFFRLLGDGVAPNTPSDDGVYLLSLRLQSNEPGVAPSEPYYFLLSKNGSSADEMAARTYVLQTILNQPIPTVSEWGLIVLALLLLTCGKIAFGFRKSAVLAN